MKNRKLLIAALALAMVFAMTSCTKKTEQQLDAEAARLEAVEAEQAAKIAELEKQLAEMAAAQSAPQTGLTETQKKEQETKAAEVAKQLQSAQTELAKTETQKQETVAQAERQRQGGNQRNNQRGNQSNNQRGNQQQTSPAVTQTQSQQPASTPAAAGGAPPASQSQSATSQPNAAAAQTQTPAATQTQDPNIKVKIPVRTDTEYELFYKIVDGKSVTIISGILLAHGNMEGSRILNWDSKNLSIPQMIEGLPVTVLGDAYLFGSISGTVTIPASVTTISGHVFQYAELTGVTISSPSSLKTIGNLAFMKCKNLKSIAIPASVTSIEEQTFQDCTSLTSVTFSSPSSLKTIGPGAFEGCTSLTSVTIPASVTEIGVVFIKVIIRLDRMAHLEAVSA
jgi:hypothetical protein